MNAQFGQAGRPRILLGFDYGETKVGVAVGNDLAASAQALEIIRYRSRADLFGRIGQLIEQWTPAALVVGRPLSADGDSIPVTALSDRFANRLAGRFGLEVARVDERYSSLAAQAQLRADRTGGEEGDDDAVAAAIILRQYLNER